MEPVVITATRTLDPIVITATRTGVLGFSATELLVGSVIVLAVLAWMLVPRMRRSHH